MESLALGTKEFLVVVFTDRLQNITALDGLVVNYEVFQDTDPTTAVSSGTATTDGMIAYCLIDTNGWDADDYNLFVVVNIAPESIRLGPFRFQVG